MSSAQILVLGAIAGFTIFLGLPLGRVQSPDARLRAALSGLATGILLFLLYDVLAHGVGPVEESLEEAVSDGGSWGEFVGLAALLAGGLVVGLMSLVYYDRWVRNRPAPDMVGPGAASVAEYAERSWFARLGAGHRLALLIATGIGLHNFGEGLAIGQAGAAGEISLALALIVGFGLHNATEGFGIVGPIPQDGVRPSWSFLGLLGLIGGGPDVRRDARRAGLGQRGADGGLHGRRRRLDPVRRPGALQRQPEVRLPGARHLDAPARARTRLRNGLRHRSRRAPASHRTLAG